MSEKYNCGRQHRIEGKCQNNGKKEEDDVLAIPEEVIIGTFTERHERITNNLRTTTDLTKFLEMICYATWA